MAAGAAVVASPVGGLGDMIVHGHNGLHADPGDVAAWADALTALLEQPDMAHRLGRQAHDDVTRTGIADHLRDLDTLVAAHRTSRHAQTRPDRDAELNRLAGSTPVTRPPVRVEGQQGRTPRRAAPPCHGIAPKRRVVSTSRRVESARGTEPAPDPSAVWGTRIVTRCAVRCGFAQEVSGRRSVVLWSDFDDEPGPVLEAHRDVVAVV